MHLLLDNHRAFLAIVDGDLHIRRGGEEARAVGREAHDVDEALMRLRRYFVLERRPLEKVDLVVLAAGGEPERARRLE